MFIPFVCVKTYSTKDHTILTDPFAVFPTTMQEDEIGSDIAFCFNNNSVLVFQSEIRIEGTDFMSNSIYTPYHIPWQIPENN